jgi:FMN phosphatase YigB (HAD superfamily)
MSGYPVIEPFDWPSIRLVAFDVDGTLYCQRSLHIRLACDLLLSAMSSRSLDAIVVLWTYRQIRERLSSHEIPDFERQLVAETSASSERSPTQVRRIVEEWIERRPLPLLAACRYPGLQELFAGIRRKGKLIGVLSDYTVNAKLSALGLYADHAVSANDESVGLLKPNPRGLQVLIEAAGVEPCQTVLIGDRTDRDGQAARRAGAHSLIKSSKLLKGWQTFSRFDGAIFYHFLSSNNRE